MPLNLAGLAEGKAEAIRRCHTGGSINELLGIEDLPQP
jgi:hypothetical protein